MRSSTWRLRASPNLEVGVSEKLSILDAMEHLLARKRDILPLDLVPVLPMNEEW